MAIIISKNGKGAQKIEQAGVKEEDYLQRYVTDNPSSLPLDTIKEDIKLLVVAREFSTDSGPIDVLAIDGDGDLYIVETKLFKNPDKRLVVAQILDYGAALWKTYGIGDPFLAEIEEHFASSEAGGLSKRLQKLYELDDEGVENVRAAIKRNLADGNIKFVVLMDRLHERLRDLILFINQKSRFSIYAVEMEFYQHEGMEIVIPKLFGAEVKKEVTGNSAGAGRRKWSEQSFFDEIDKNLSPKECAVIRRLYEASKDIADKISWGTGTASGSFSPKFLQASPRSLFTVDTDGILSLNFGWYGRGKEEEKFPNQERFRDRFKIELDGVGFYPIPNNYVDDNFFLSVPKAAWMPKLDEFLGVIYRVFKKSADLKQ